jgi:hypothetical protein
MASFSKIKDGSVFALAPPAIPGFGNTSGFDFYLQDINGAGHDKLIEARNQLLAAAAKSSLLTGTRPNGQEDTPQYSVRSIRRRRARSVLISPTSIPRCRRPGADLMSTISSIAAASSRSMCKARPISGCSRKTSTAGMSAIRGVDGAVLGFRKWQLDLWVATT